MISGKDEKTFHPMGEGAVDDVARGFSLAFQSEPKGSHYMSGIPISELGHNGALEKI